MDTPTLYYHDRRQNRLVTDRVHAAQFLNWSANTRTGCWATELVLRHRWINHLYGWYHRRPLSRRKIGFVERLNVNMSESVRSISDFESFNDFFTREIDLSRRPVDPAASVCVAPADGRALAFDRVHADTTFRIKRSAFNLRRFLNDRDLLSVFDGGSMVISRLYLGDYHHFHFPDSGIPGSTVNIHGSYYPVSPYSLRSLVPFYTENHRVWTPFTSDHFGGMLLVEIGAFTVGSIQQRYRPGVRVAKGAPKGFFELGGSTVVMLFQPGRIVLDEDLCDNTKKDVETYVRMGESVGSIPTQTEVGDL